MGGGGPRTAQIWGHGGRRRGSRERREDQREHVRSGVNGRWETRIMTPPAGRKAAAGHGVECILRYVKMRFPVARGLTSFRGCSPSLAAREGGREKWIRRERAARADETNGEKIASEGEIPRRRESRPPISYL